MNGGSNGDEFFHILKYVAGGVYIGHNVSQLFSGV